jgi:hypothetical protein
MTKNITWVRVRQRAGNSVVVTGSQQGEMGVYRANRVYGSPLEVHFSMSIDAAVTTFQ